MKTNALAVSLTLSLVASFGCSTRPDTSFWSDPSSTGQPSSSTGTQASTAPPVDNASSEDDAGTASSASATSTGTQTPSAPADIGAAGRGGPGQDAAASPGDGGSSNPGAFDAGSGVLQPDGHTVVFTIPAGTGSQDWNTSNRPIRVKRGWTLKMVDDDPGNTPQHILHTFGQPCPHELEPVSLGGNLCVINAAAPLGMQQGTLDHAGGLVFIYVVE
jgi:hypothetical protein